LCSVPAVDYVALANALTPIVQQQLLPIQQQLLPINEKLNVLQNMETALNHLMSSAMDPWEKTSGSRSHAAADGLSEDVLSFYGFNGDHRLCHIVGKVKHASAAGSSTAAGGQADALVKTAHIWPNHTNGVGLPLFGLAIKDLTSPRNFLRLHEQVEKAFDHRRLTIVFHGGQLSAYVLDPSLMNMRIKGTQYTFRDCHQYPLTFLNDERPFHRLLAAHAAKSFAFAEVQGWIQPHERGALEIKAKELARHSLDEVARANIERWAISSGRAGAAGAGASAFSSSSPAFPAAAATAPSAAALVSSASAASPSPSSGSVPSAAPPSASSFSPLQTHALPIHSGASALPAHRHRQRGKGAHHRQHQQPQKQLQQPQQPSGSSS